MPYKLSDSNGSLCIKTFLKEDNNTITVCYENLLHAVLLDIPWRSRLEIQERF